MDSKLLSCCILSLLIGFFIRDIMSNIFVCDLFEGLRRGRATAEPPGPPPPNNNDPSSGGPTAGTCVLRANSQDICAKASNLNDCNSLGNMCQWNESTPDPARAPNPPTHTPSEKPIPSVCSKPFWWLHRKCYN